MHFQNFPSIAPGRIGRAMAAVAVAVSILGTAMDLAAADLKELNTIRKSVMGGRTPLRGNEKNLNDWYTQRLVAMATAKEGVEQIRREILNDLRAARQPEARVLVKNRLMAVLPKLINAPENPPPDKLKIDTPARINGLLLLGELNDSEALLRGADPTPPVPSADARGELMKVVAAPNQKTALKVAALVGLRRHVQLAMIDGGQQLGPDAAAIVSMLTSILTSNPASPTEQDGHYWMQRQAADMLGIIGTAGPNGEVAIALDKIVRDDQLPKWLRCACLDAIGRITVPAQVQQLNPDETVAAIGELAVATCNTEATRLKVWEEEQSRLDSMMGDGAFGSNERARRAPPPREEPPARGSRTRPGRRNDRRSNNRRDEEFEDSESGFDAPTEEEYFDPGADLVLAVRRRLKDRLGSVRAGLSSDPTKGIRAIASSGNAQTIVGQLDKQLVTLLAALDAQNAQPSDLRQTIESGSRAMSGLLAGGPKTAPAAAAPPASNTGVSDGDPF